MSYLSIPWILDVLCGTSSVFSDFISSRMQEENREQKGRKEAQKVVKGREMMARREEKMEKEERQQGRGKAEPALGGGSAWCCAQGAVCTFPGQRPLAPSPSNHRGQCEAGLFGDVFAAGPVCLFSIIIIFFPGIGCVWGREEGGDQHRGSQ